MLTKDFYSQVTANVIADLETGVPTWVKPWITSPNNGIGLFPANAQTNRHYSGINIAVLWNSAFERLYQTHAWLTFKQAREAGGAIRKGETGTRIVYSKMSKITDKETGEEKEIPLLKVYTVFNLDQIDGLPDNIMSKPMEIQDGDIFSNVTQFIKETGANIVIGGNQPLYSSKEDKIYCTPKDAFASYEDYLATLLHELVHWSGHTSRLKREGTLCDSKSNYAFEELVAELGAAFLCAKLGLKGKLQHSEYISGWIKVLEQDNKAITRASSQASKAANFLIGLTLNAEAA